MTKIPSLPLYLSPLFILLPPCPHSCLGSHSLFLTFWWNNQPPSLCVIFNYSLLSQLCSVLGCCVTQGTERWESTASFCSAVPASCRKSLHLFFSDWHIPLLVLHIIIFPFPFIRHLWWLRLLLEQHQVLSCLLVLLPWFPVFLTPCYCTDITPILLARVLNTGSTPTVMSGMTERSNHYLIMTEGHKQQRSHFCLFYDKCLQVAYLFPPISFLPPVCVPLSWVRLLFGVALNILHIVVRWMPALSWPQ